MNPALRELGFDERDRVAIIHADDIGMCQATLPAMANLLEAGLISSAAAMVPCPWFRAVAELCHQASDVDMGVHLTLTCEYHTYRWGPVSTRDPASGLLDEEGYFPSTPDRVQIEGRPEAAAHEMRQQLAQARAAGIDVTHVDTHQLSALHAKFLAAYSVLALESRLPLMLLRLNSKGWHALGQALGLPFDRETTWLLEEAVHKLESQGIPLIDHATMLPLDQPQDRIAQARAMFEALPAGLTHFVLHPAVDTPELRAIAPDWPSRVADYQAFASRELREYVRRSGVQIIGYRVLRGLLPKQKGGVRTSRR